MKKKVSVIYFITFIVAFCSIVYELLMAQTLSLLSGNSVVMYSTTIGLYLASLGLGAFLCTDKRLVRSVETLWKVEILLSLVGGVAVLLLHFSHMLHTYLMVNLHYTMGLILFFTFSYGVIAVIGILSGFELPLLIHIREQEEEKTANLVLGVDYFASLTGAVVFALVLLPWLGVLRAGFMTAMLNVLAAFILLYYMRGIGRRFFRVCSLCNLSILCLLILSLSFSSDVDQYLLQKFFYWRESAENLGTVFYPMETQLNVEHYRSRHQNIDIVERDVDAIERLIVASYSDKYDSEPSYPDGYALYLNGDYQFFSSYEEVYHEYFVHVPIIANKVPKKVLVLGAGDGLINRELLKYKDVESITLVEIDSKIIQVSMTHPVIRRMNRDSLKDPRVTVKVMDAFYFVKTTQETYDAIFMDFPVPKNYNLSKLYSMEFYSFVRKCLKKDGFVVIDAPGGEMLDIGSDWAIYYNTMKAAGFETIVPYLALLEDDNPKVNEKFKAMQLEMAEHEMVDVEVIRKRLGVRWWRMLLAMRFKFYMMKNGVNGINMEYKDYGIETYVLNEKRYESAFNIYYSLPDTIDWSKLNILPETIDWSKVNSIMRPTLPSSSPFTVQVPY